jgi:hypothetical protein
MVELDSNQYKLFKRYILDLYNDNKFKSNNGYDKIIENQWRFIKDSIEYCLDFTISISDNASQIILTQDEYGNKEYGTRLTEHYCLVLNVSLFNNDYNLVEFKFDKNKFELDLENELPLINSDA